MRMFLFCLVLFGVLAAQAAADPHTLEGGALIAHNIDHVFRDLPTQLCSVFYEYNPISNCNDQNNSVQVSEYQQVSWFVVAAFDEDKEWCEVQFGMGDYDPSIMAFLYTVACFPSTAGGLELASSEWPGPGSGVTLIATDSWQGNWVPLYYFFAYAYAYSSGGVVQLVPDPTDPEPFGGFRNCLEPQGEWDAALGGLGVNQPGTWVCWGWEYGVCCLGDDCIVVQSEQECVDLGGEFHPESDNCDPPNPCAGTPANGTRWGSIKALYR